MRKKPRDIDNPSRTASNDEERLRFTQRQWPLKDQEARQFPSLRPITETETFFDEKRTSVERYERDYLTIDEYRSLGENVRQKSECPKPRFARIHGRGHGRRFDVVKAYRLYEPGMLRRIYIQRLTEAFEFRDPATARRWVKQMEDQGYFKRVGSPARLETTDKTHRLGGWRKGKEAIEGAIAAMPGNVKAAWAAREADYLRARGWLVQKGWNFPDGIERWYDGTREDGIFYFLREHALRIQRERDRDAQAWSQ